MVGQHLRQRVTQYPRLLPMSERKNVKLSHAHMFADPLRHLRMRPRGRSEPMALQTGIAEAWSLLRYCNDGSLHCRKAPLFPVGCYVTLRAGRTLCRAPLPAGGIETCRACPWWARRTRHIHCIEGRTGACAHPTSVGSAAVTPPWLASPNSQGCAGSQSCP